MSSKLLMIHCLSPLHAGVGQGVDVVDLAIARERSTGFPYLPGSSIKGSLRDRAASIGEANVVKVFGPSGENASDHAGCVAFGDGNLVCLPTRSVAGTFAYVTSPYLLQRLSRDLEAVGQTSVGSVPNIASAEKVKITKTSILKAADGRVYFEDFDFNAESDQAVNDIADRVASLIFDNAEQRELFVKRFCIVHDDVMSFLSKHGTDVITRVSIENETKTAKAGQLWTEENLPSESILSSLVSYIEVKSTKITESDAFGVIGRLVEEEVQFGGKATVGRGRCRARLSGGVK